MMIRSVNIMNKEALTGGSQFWRVRVHDRYDGKHDIRQASVTVEQ